jgi:hypothetical protein
MPRTAPRAVRRKARPVNQIHRKVAARKAARKVGQVKFVVTEYTDAK